MISEIEFLEELQEEIVYVENELAYYMIEQRLAKLNAKQRKKK